MAYVRRGYNWDDFAEIPFTATEVAYLVGTNALASDPNLTTLYPALARNPDTKKPGFTAHNVLLYATQDCYVRFNGPNRVQHRLLAGNFYQFNLKIHTIYVVRVTNDGVLYAHFEG